MKNQYFGDINDYSKYGILRILCDTFPSDVAVCWMLTPDDSSTDGTTQRDYITKPDKYRDCSPHVFDQLRELINDHKANDVCHAQKVIGKQNLKFIDAILKDDKNSRQEYFEMVKREISECDLVFFDPDIGMAPDSAKKGGKDSSKYLFWDELADFYNEQHKSILLYQHWPRRPKDEFVGECVEKIKEYTKAYEVFSFRDSRVVYFLIPQPKHHDWSWESIFKLEKTWEDQLIIDQELIIKPIEEEHFEFLSDIKKLNPFAKIWSKKLFERFPEFRKFLRIDLGAEKAWREYVIKTFKPDFQNSINDERWLGRSLVIIQSPPGSKFKYLKIETQFVLDDPEELNPDGLHNGVEDLVIDLGVCHRHFAGSYDQQYDNTTYDEYINDGFEDGIEFIREIINEEIVIIYSEDKSNIRSFTELHISKGETVSSTSWNGTYNSIE
jgi:hypothetical protein